MRKRSRHPSFEFAADAAAWVEGTIGCCQYGRSHASAEVWAKERGGESRPPQKMCRSDSNRLSAV